MLNRRILTASLLLGVLGLCLFLPLDWLFPTFVVLVLGLGSWEWTRLAGVDQHPLRFLYVAVNFLLLLGAALVYDHLLPQVYRLSLFSFWFWVLLIPLLVRYPRYTQALRSSWLTALAGTIILLSTSTGLLWLKMQAGGEWLVLMLIGIVAMADTGAYFAGKALGRRKLAENISPGKTFEGVYGGLIANFIFGIVLSSALRLDVEQSFLLFVVIFSTDLFSVLGDLLESALKRYRGLKDSGKWLPGHGGILDRIDGLCAATPCFVLGNSLLQGGVFG